jgi:ATP synthase protein I
MSDEPRPANRNRQILEASSLGLMFPLAIGIGFLWGWSMDRLFGTRPWLTVIFSACGVAAAFLNLFRMTKIDDAG